MIWPSRSSRCNCSRIWKCSSIIRSSIFGLYPSCLMVHAYWGSDLVNARAVNLSMVTLVNCLHAILRSCSVPKHFQHISTNLEGKLFNNVTKSKCNQNAWHSACIGCTMGVGYLQSGVHVQAFAGYAWLDMPLALVIPHCRIMWLLVIAPPL